MLLLCFFLPILYSSAFGLQSLVLFHPPSFFLPICHYLPSSFGFPPLSLVPFIFQSLNYPWGGGHPLQEGFCENMKGAGRWAEMLSFLCFIYLLHKPPISYLTLGRQWGGRSGCSLLQALGWFRLMFPSSLNHANADKKCRCLKISQIAENIWSVAFYLLLDGNSLFLQSVVLMEHPKLEAQNIALYSNISLCSLTNRVNSFYIRLCGE